MPEQIAASLAKSLHQSVANLLWKQWRAVGAMANADSPSNLSWLVNNAQMKKEDVDLAAPTIPGVALDFDETSPEGASFSEFTLHLDDSPSR